MAQATLSQAIKQAGYNGWDFDEPVEEIQYVPSRIPGEKPDEVKTGVFTVNVTDPTGKYNKQIKLRKAPHEPGTGQAGPGGGWIVAEAPDMPKPPADTKDNIWTDPYGGLYEKDAQGVWKPVVQGDTGKYEISQENLNALKVKNADVAANVAAGRGALTTEQIQSLDIQRAAGTVSADTLKQRRAEFEETNKLAAAAEKRLGETAAAGVKLTTAQTGGVEIETKINEQRLKDLIAAAPTTQEAARLTNELTQLQKRQAEQALKKPTITSLGEGPTYGVVGPEGTIEERMRGGYVPKTGAEIGARIGQLDALAKAKGAEITGKVGEGYTQEQALKDFNTWYDQNVGGQLPALQAAQEEARYARGKELATQRQQSITSALGAGTQQISAYNASSGEGIDPEFGKLLAASAAGKQPEGVDYSKMFARPEGGGVQERVQRATADALKYIDEDAARQMGMPQPTWMTQDPREALNATRYMQGGQPAPAPAPGQPAPAPGQTAPAAAPAALLPPGAAGVAGQDPRLSGSQQPPSQVTTSSGDLARYDAQGNLTGIEYINTAPPGYEDMMAQQAEFDSRQAADLQAMMAPAAAGIPAYRPPVARRPVARRPVAPAPVGNMDVDFAPGSLPTPAYPVAPPVYDPAYEPMPVKPIWAPGGYVPPQYLYGGQNAVPVPY